jgi:hypothetical protein
MKRGLTLDSFGWVNASYVYGLSFIPIHMKRALGTLTPYDTFAKATQINLSAVDESADETIQEGSDESRPDSSDEADAAVLSTSASDTND